jgi:hypothetical protein
LIVDGRVVIDDGWPQTVSHDEILAGSQRTADSVWSCLRALYPGV